MHINLKNGKCCFRIHKPKDCHWRIEETFLSWQKCDLLHISGNFDKIRRIFPDGQTPSDDPDMIGLCCNSDHLRTVFYNSTVVNDTKCTVPLHGKKRHSQENVFWQFHLFYEMLLFYFVSGLIRMAIHTSLYEKRTRPMSLNSGIRFGTLPKIH